VTRLQGIFIHILMELLVIYFFPILRRAKSPSFVPTSLYGEAFNASLQSALGFGAEGGHPTGAGHGGIPPFLAQSMAASLHQQREREAAEKHLSHHAMIER